MEGAKKNRQLRLGLSRQAYVTRHFQQPLVRVVQLPDGWLRQVECRLEACERRRLSCGHLDPAFEHRLRGNSTYTSDTLSHRGRGGTAFIPVAMVVLPTV